MENVADTLTFARTVDRILVHREGLGEVFLTDMRRLDDDSYAAGAQLPRSHAYYGDDVVRPALYDVVLLMEACRQAALAGAHSYYEVPAGHKFILTHFAIHLLHPQRTAVGPRPCELCLVATTKNRRVRDGQVGGLDYDILLSTAGTPVGQVSLGLRFKSPADYARLRLRQRDGAEPPSSATHQHMPVGWPLDAHLVGRSNPDNVVLVDAVAGDRGARALLRVHLNHPSMFDHPQDHIPGMVLAEAGRQLARYAVTEHLSIAPSKMHINDLHAVFTKVRRARTLDRAVPRAGRAQHRGRAPPWSLRHRRRPAGDRRGAPGHADWPARADPRTSRCAPGRRVDLHDGYRRHDARRPDREACRGMSWVHGGRMAVWTDFGGVLTPPVSETLVDFARRVGVAPDVLRAAMVAVGAAHGTDMMAPLDTPLMTEEEWTGEVEKMLRVGWSVEADLSHFADKWFADRPANEEWVTCLRDLRARGCFVGLLSNMVPTWERHWRAMVPPDGLFDDLVFSYLAGCRKPGTEIFALAARRAGLPPSKCVLVDDLPANCRGAEAAGWHAVHFTTAAEAWPLVTGLVGRVAAAAR